MNPAAKITPEDVGAFLGVSNDHANNGHHEGKERTIWADGRALYQRPVRRVAHLWMASSPPQASSW